MKVFLKIIGMVFLVLVLAGAVIFAVNYLPAANAPDFYPAAEEYMQGVIDGAYSEDASSEAGKKLQGLMRNAAEYSADLGREKKGSRAQVGVTYSYLDLEALKAQLSDTVAALAEARVESARSLSGIYASDGGYDGEFVMGILCDALDTVEPYDCLHYSAAYLKLEYSDKEWKVAADEALNAAYTADCDALAQELYDFTAADIPFIEKHYTIPADAKAGPAPDQSCFGSTDDPEIINELLASPAAQRLIKNQHVSWNDRISRFPDSVINYYLDDTILMLQWQEVTAGAVGTYGEVFVADASQVRRKVVNDTLGGWDFEFATNLAKQSNAVLAVGGDFYNHARACGIVYYDNELYRFEPDSCDTMYFDRNGDMVFSHRYKFSNPEQVYDFIEEHGIEFSVAFGPVLVENGKDVTPSDYPWGEINDTYARAAIGQLGRLHYLTLNINVKVPNYNNYAQLRRATEAMLDHGCISAYALDGGQTAETIVNGVMINPVQFGEERLVSDILYFATAMPEE